MLDNPTLVLNRSWQPVATTPVRRALTLMALGVAGAVDPADFRLADWTAWIEEGPRQGPAIRGVGYVVPVPEVIVLRRYGGMPQLAVPYTRRNVVRRDGLRCQYCGRTPGLASLTIDHVVPRSRGGETSWRNCVTACLGCNGRKADRTLEQSGMRLLRTPQAPTWPGGLDPRALSERPAWQRFVPRSRLDAMREDLEHHGRLDRLAVGG